MTLSLSFRQRPNGRRRSGHPKLEWTLRRPNGRTVARYHCSPITFDPQRLVELVNRSIPVQSRVDTIPVYLL